MARFTQKIRDLLFGTPFGEVFPPKVSPPPLAVDGRTVALRVLREYITNLVFYRPMAVGQPPQAFNITEENFHIEWPDNVDTLKMPSIAVVPSLAQYAVIGLTCYVEEKTRDVYKKGTVLQWQSEYTENIKLEIWASKPAERRAILAGLETALTPTEQMSGLRFRMPDYFNELVCFTLNDRLMIDDRQSSLNRRRVQLGIEMRFNVVALVNYVPLRPMVSVNTDVNQSTGLPIDLSLGPDPQVLPPGT